MRISTQNMDFRILAPIILASKVIREKRNIERERLDVALCRSNPTAHRGSFRARHPADIWGHSGECPGSRTWGLSRTESWGSRPGNPAKTNFLARRSMTRRRVLACWLSRNNALSRNNRCFCKVFVFFCFLPVPAHPF